MKRRISIIAMLYLQYLIKFEIFFPNKFAKMSFINCAILKLSNGLIIQRYYDVRLSNYLYNHLITSQLRYNYNIVFYIYFLIIAIRCHQLIAFATIIIINQQIQRDDKNLTINKIFNIYAIISNL